MKARFWSEPSNWLIVSLIGAYASGIVLWGLGKLGWIDASLTTIIYLILLLVPILASPFVWRAMARRHRIQMAKIAARAQRQS